MLIAGIILAVYGPQIKGRLGESAVKHKLNELDKEEYIILHDLLLPYKNATTQLDHIVISPYGIFVIETKNYKGWIFGKEEQRNWTQVIYNKKSKFLNPIMQNYAHITALKGILDDTYSGPYFSMIAFAGQATFKNIEISSPHVEVFYISQLVKKIQEKQEQILYPFSIKQIQQKIVEKNIVGNESRKAHTQAIINKKQQLQRNIQSNTCPKCQSQLVQRRGKYGPFLGCSNFPKCRFVLNIK